jgi:hypothetical protein
MSVEPQRPGDGERSKDREEGRRHRREFKEHGNKCSLDDTFI